MLVRRYTFGGNKLIRLNRETEYGETTKGISYKYMIAIALRIWFMFLLRQPASDHKLVLSFVKLQEFKYCPMVTVQCNMQINHLKEPFVTHQSTDDDNKNKNNNKTHVFVSYIHNNIIILSFSSCRRL